MDNRLLKIILEELSNSLKDKFNTVRDRFISEGISLQEAEKLSAMLIIKEFNKKDFQDVMSNPSNMDTFIDKASDSVEAYEKAKKEFDALGEKEPMLSKGLAFLRQTLNNKFEEKKKAGKLKVSAGEPEKKSATPEPPKEKPKADKPKAEKPKPAADPDLEYLNKIQNMTPGDLRKLGMSLSKNRTERDRVISALRKAPGAAGKLLAKKLNISPADISAEKKPTDAKPATPAALTTPQKPAAKEPAAPAAAPTKSVAPKPKKKKAPPKPMTVKKAQDFVQKYKDFTDGGDDKQISKKFTISKKDKKNLPKFGKVKGQSRGGTKQQADDRDTAATPHVSGDNVPTGDKGDSVSCLRGRVMTKDLWNKREAIGREIMGGGKNKKTGKPLPFGRNRWTDGVKRDNVADAKAIKAVINFMGAAARYGYDPVKYWPNFLWATATHLVLKGQPKSKECLDPRKPKDVETHRKLQAQKKSKMADGVDITLREDFCLEGCTDEQIQEANSKRNVKNIAKYKQYVANLRQKSKGMNLDQFLDLIKYKE